MCGYICADVNTSWGGPAKASAKSIELYTIKAGPLVVKLVGFCHFMNKVALFHSQLCVGLDVWHKRFYVNEEHKNIHVKMPQARNNTITKTTHKQHSTVLTVLNSSPVSWFLPDFF